jgi:hypothetical protein
MTITTGAVQRERWNDMARGEESGKLWLFLLKSGGRWLSGDVAKATRTEGTHACWLLAAMARNSNVSRFPVAGKTRRFAYGVTAGCKVPRFVTLGQVAECVMAQAPDREEVLA